MDISVIVVTHNRAVVLRETLAALARLRTKASWELLVVDNGSIDSTRDDVKSAAESFPVAVRYQYEPAPGKYGALNNGIVAARGRFIAATDDDAFPREDWLDRALEGFRRFDCGFVGGPVLPVWCGQPPDWLEATSALAGKVLALQDYGREAREYGTDIAWPLGVNVAYRREVFERAGLFDSSLGRVAGTLRSQAQREWHVRTRNLRIAGMYLPGMIVDHIVPAERLTKQYFRRWFYWHGISRVMLHRTTGLDLFEPDGAPPSPTEQHIMGIPTTVWRRMARSGASWLRRQARRDPAAAFEYELWLTFCYGIVRQRWCEAYRVACLSVSSPCLRGRLMKSVPTAR